MRKVTNGLISNVLPAIQEFHNLFSVKPPIMLSTAVALHEDDVLKLFQKYDKSRILICEKWADKNPEDNKPIIVFIDRNGNEVDKEAKDAQGNPLAIGTKYQMTDENKELFQKDWDELLNIEVDVQSFQVTLDQIKGFDVEPAAMPHLSAFLKFFVAMPVD